MNRPDRLRETLPRLPDLPRPLPLFLDLAPQPPPFVLPVPADDCGLQGQHRVLDVSQLGQRSVPRGDRLVVLDLPGQAHGHNSIGHRDGAACFELLVAAPEGESGQVGKLRHRQLTGPPGNGAR